MANGGLNCQEAARLLLDAAEREPLRQGRLPKERLRPEEGGTPWMVF